MVGDDLIEDVIYRPNSGSPAALDILSDTIQDIMDGIQLENKSSVFRADMKIYLLNFDSKRDAGEYLNNIILRCYLLIIT